MQDLSRETDRSGYCMIGEMRQNDELELSNGLISYTKSARRAKPIPEKPLREACFWRNCHHVTQRHLQIHGLTTCTRAYASNLCNYLLLTTSLSVSPSSPASRPCSTRPVKYPKPTFPACLALVFTLKVRTCLS